MTKKLDVKTFSAAEIAKKHKVPLSHIMKQLAMGRKVEQEHTTSTKTADEIARDHLGEDPNYYTKLSKAHLEEGKTLDRAKRAAGVGLTLANLYTAGDVMSRAQQGEGSPVKDAVTVASTLPGTKGWAAYAADKARVAYDHVRKTKAVKEMNIGTFPRSKNIEDMRGKGEVVSGTSWKGDAPTTPRSYRASSASAPVKSQGASPTVKGQATTDQLSHIGDNGTTPPAMSGSEHTPRRYGTTRKDGVSPVTGTYTNLNVRMPLEPGQTTPKKSINEKITEKTPVKNVIHDFVHSKNKRFAGDSKKQRIKRALGAYYAMHEDTLDETSLLKKVKYAAKAAAQQTRIAKELNPGDVENDKTYQKRKRGLDRVLKETKKIQGYQNWPGEKKKKFFNGPKDANGKTETQKWAEARRAKKEKELEESNKLNKLKKRDWQDPKKRKKDETSDFDPRRMLSSHNRKRIEKVAAASKLSEDRHKELKDRYFGGGKELSDKEMDELRGYENQKKKRPSAWRETKGPTPRKNPTFFYGRLKEEQIDETGLVGKVAVGAGLGLAKLALKRWKAKQEREMDKEDQKKKKVAEGYASVGKGYAYDKFGDVNKKVKFYGKKPKNLKSEGEPGAKDTYKTSKTSVPYAKTKIDEVSAGLAHRATHHAFVKSDKMKKDAQKEPDMHSYVQAMHKAEKKSKQGVRFANYLAKKMDEEQIDEISSEKAARYIRGARKERDVAHKNWNNYSTSVKEIKHGIKRWEGMKLASDKLLGRAKVQTSEETQIDEISAKLVGKVHNKRLERGEAPSRTLSNAVKKKWLASDVGKVKTDDDPPFTGWQKRKHKKLSVRVHKLALKGLKAQLKEEEMDNKDTITEALDNILQGKLDEMRSNLKQALDEKAIERLNDRKKEIAEDYFGQ